MLINRAKPAHLAVLPVAAATLLVLAGCKGFWDPPSGTGSGSTATTTTLAASNSTVSAGASVTLTATVSPSAATGTVTFYSGTTSIGTGTLSSGTATFAATFSAAGTESLKAMYGGDSTYAASTSSAVSVTVTSAAAAALARATSGSGPNHATNLVLSSDTVWQSPTTAHLHNLARLVADQSAAANIDSSHCVLYSGTLYLVDGTESLTGIYNLQSGGSLAPEEKAMELGCK